MNPIILYDGECGFCDFWVRLIIRHDREARFRFAAFQSRSGRELCLAHGLDPEQQSSLILIDPQRGSQALLRKSDAVLAILEQLGGVWRIAALFKAVPRSGRDAIYDFVARNRYRWFGRAELKEPAGEERDRFLP